MLDDDPQYLLQWMDILGCTDAHIWLLFKIYRQLGLKFDELLIAQLPEHHDDMPENIYSVQLRPASESGLRSGHVAEAKTG